jgi:hypothetical protein
MKASMNYKFNLMVLVLVFTFLSCKNDTNTTLATYKFADKGIVLNCEGTDSDLINEALFAFEDDINTFYSKASPSPNLGLSYAKFMRDAINGNVNYSEILTPHTVEVFKVLQTKSDLWDTKNTESHLDYYSSFFSCMANNVQDKSLNTTLNALLSTNSMSSKLFMPALTSRYREVVNDKYLAAYIAFDLFYAKLFEVDLTQVKEREPAKVDFNLVPQLPSN